MPIDCRELIFSGHAVRRMFQRSLTTQDVSAVIAYGEVIAEYPGDTPLPSYLLLHWLKDRPIHVVVAVDKETQQCFVITAYVPDSAQWQADFKTRRKP
jgi:hypothetical protein